MKCTKKNSKTVFNYDRAASEETALLIREEVFQIQELYLISPMAPSFNHYLAYRAIIKNGRPMAMSYKTNEAKKYQSVFSRYVKEQAKRQGWIKSDNPFQHYYMDTIFYFPRIDMDANNYYKCLADAITDSGVVWSDDNQLCERVQGIYYDTENPRIEMKIYEVDYIGVFNNATQLEQFESRCIGCTRYKRNCSLLNKAKEGRIQKEIRDGFCEKYKAK